MYLCIIVATSTWLAFREEHRRKQNISGPKNSGRQSIYLIVSQEVKKKHWVKGLEKVS